MNLPAADPERLDYANASGEPWSASATARRVLRLPEPPERSALNATVHRTLERLGGPVGLAVAVAPTVAFVAADAAAGLTTALVAVVVTAVVACAVRLIRRESPGAAVAGLVVAGICAAVAALAGEARAFFLPTMVVPVLFVVVYVVSLLAGRPLMGLMVNPLSGGPRHWRLYPALRRIYTVSSLIGMTMAVANFLVRLAFYLADQPGSLAVVQVIASSLFAVHFAVTLVVARRVAGRPFASAPTPLAVSSQP